MNLFERARVVSAIIPLDLQTARDGDWVSLKNYSDCDVIVFKGAGTAGDDPVISFQQATSVGGGSAKDLAQIERIYKQQGTLTAVGTQTVVTQSAGASYTGDGTSAESEAVYGFHIHASQLDVTNGFDCIRVRVADVGGNAQLGCALYVLSGPRYGSATGTSAIVD